MRMGTVYEQRSDVIDQNAESETGMDLTGREFIRTSGVIGAGFTVRRAAAIAAAESVTNSQTPTAAQSSGKNRFVLGGTGFIGPNLVRYAVARGHHVPIFTSGRTEADLPESVERLVGDRNENLSALDGRTWDVVLDHNTYDYRWVERSTDLLKNAAGQCIFVSSISAYDTSSETKTDTSTVIEKPKVDGEYTRFSPGPNWNNGDEAHYGLIKRLSEDIASTAFPGRATIVRPGLIVEPCDKTERYTYWPRRIENGNEVLAACHN